MTSKKEWMQYVCDEMCSVMSSCIFFIISMHNLVSCAGDQMVFFLLDIVVLVEFIWMLKPFLALPEQFSPS